MSEPSPYELPAPITAGPPAPASLIGAAARAFRSALRQDRPAPVAALRAMQAVPRPDRSPALLREAAAHLLREAATLQTSLGPVAVALAVGAIESTSALSSETAGQAAMHGTLTAAVELGPYAELIVSRALRAAVLPADLVSQARHDVRSIGLR